MTALIGIRKFVVGAACAVLLLHLLFSTAGMQAQTITEIPPPTDLPLLTITPSATFTPTFTATPTVTVPAATIEPTPEIIPPAEVTAAIEQTPELTPQVTDAAPVTASPQPPETTASAELPVETTAEATSDVTALPTAEITPAVSVTALPSPTPTLTLETVLIAGRARYQSRDADNSGITLTAYTIDRVLISSAQTDMHGGYTLTVPAHDFYWLTADAPRYQPFVRGVYPQETVPPIVLAGGDLDDDGCIGAADIALLQVDLDTHTTRGDINADAVTDVRDLAILTGNFDPTCQPAQAATATPIGAEQTPDAATAPETLPLEQTPELTAEPVAEATADATAEATTPP